MKKLFTLAMVFTVLGLAACVPSIHPFYENKDLYFEKNLLGIWTDGDGSESWKFEKAGDLEYRMEYKDENGMIGIFEARLFRMRGRTFLDLTPFRPAFIKNDLYGGHLIPAHTLMQISTDGKTAQMSYLDPAWLKQFLQKRPGSVRHTIVDDEVMFTDSTKNLQAFIAESLNSPGAFEETESVIKQRGEN